MAAASRSRSRRSRPRRGVRRDSGRGAADSRSRSRRPRGGGRESDRSRRDRRDTRPSPRQSIRSGRQQRRQPEPKPEPKEEAQQEAPEERQGKPEPPGKSARDKAKEATAKEREKARLKKLERETAQKEKEQQRQELRNQKRLKQAAYLVDARQAKIEESVEEASVKRLFGLLDRNGQGKVCQKDVLMALRKHHPVRQLFGVAGDSDEAARLQERLSSIQEAFEAGSGLGQVSPLFSALKEASDCGNAFAWEPFLDACQRGLLKEWVKVAINSLPREHSQGQAFVASRQWQVVPPGAACPAGLEFRMDMASGHTMARLPQKAPS